MTQSCIRCAEPLPPGAGICPRCYAVQESLEPTHVRPSGETVPFGVSQPGADSHSGPVVVPLQLQQPGLLEGKWLLDGVLGVGGMGTVYRARDKALDRVVAIKLLSDRLAASAEFIGRFEREAQMMAKLEHPNLVPIYAVGHHAGSPFLVMKFLEGLPLDALVARRGGRLPPADVIAVARQVCAGLAFIHGHGLIHRDLKPANLFMSPEGHVTILDLGLARPQKSEGVTRTGAVLGTPGYMAPEQMSGAEELDHRADLYSLGVILFELITGSPPFIGPTDFDIMFAHRTQPAPDASTVSRDVPPAVAAVLGRALAKNRAERFPSAAALLSALEQSYAPGAEPPPPPPRFPPPAPAPRSKLGAVIAAAAIAVTATAVIFIALRPGVPLPIPIPIAAPAPAPAKVEPLPTPVAPPVPTPVVIAPVAPTPIVPAVKKPGPVKAADGRGPRAAPRARHTAERIGGFVYVLGGTAANKTLGTLERARVNADGTLDRFTSYGRELLQPRACHASVVLGPWVYLLGGEVLGGSELSSIERARIGPDGSLGGFQEARPKLNVARACHAVVLIGNALYVVGGSAGGGKLRSVERAPILPGGELGDFELMASTLEVARSGLSLIALGDSVYAIGGLDDSIPIRPVERAQLGTDGRLATFLTAPGITSWARTGGAAIALGDRLYLVGGVTDAAQLNEIAPLDTDRGLGGDFAIIRDGSVRQLRRFHATVLIGDRLLIIGGEAVGPGATGLLDDVEQAPFNSTGALGTAFSLASAALPEGRTDLKTVTLGDFVYFLGGTNAAGEPVTAVDRAEIKPGGGLGPVTASGVTLTVPRAAPTVLVSGGALYVLGGEAPGAPASMEKAELGVDGTLGPFTAVGDLSVQTPRARSVAMATGGFLHLLTGRRSDGVDLADIERSPIDLLTRRPGVSFQSSGAAFPEASSDASLAVPFDRVTLVGGWGTGGALATVSQRELVGSNLDDATILGPALIRARAGHASVIIGDALWVIGGASGTPANPVPRESLEYSWAEADGRLQGFSVSGPLLQPGRYGHAAFVLGDWLYVAGGKTASATLSVIERTPLR